MTIEPLPSTANPAGVRQAVQELTGTLGVGVAYHPTPLDAEAVGRLVREQEQTFLFTTPIFHQLHLHGCAAEDFGNLRIFMVRAGV